MKAIVIDSCGSADRLELREVEKPAATGSQVLVRVRAVSVNPIDWKIRRGMLRPLYPRKFPFILGGDAAGEVEEVGSDVRGWKPGDAVYCATSARGAYAEYVAVDVSQCAPLPMGLTFEEAAAIPLAGLTALQAWRDKARVKSGDRVLVNGASGGVGTFAVQIAAALDCEVTAVTSAGNLELVRQLGAAHVIDYAHVDFIRQRERYDAILDAVANKSFSRCRPVLRPGGAYITTLPGAGSMTQTLTTRLTQFVGNGKRCHFMLTKSRGSDLQYLGELIAAGRLRPVIDRTYRLDEMRHAHEYGEQGHARGKIVISVP